MTTKFARQLKAARLRLGYTLRDVEGLSGKKITNAYLNQIEQCHIDDVSPKKLRVLSDVLKLDYIWLLKRAGHIKAGDCSRHMLFQNGERV